ncbi:hypothetical protein LS482_19300 [Sinomicrobium kalidii]|uniref:hypothetical protein n=1 Tax=Sinomicrobium kalidii TaxID=2900738 RepID=UPI001E42DD63|nr:hypothetical protein [Sinomicrobium kalidii]UGU15814.1 hypothetical protein LS482_19300 [Sinomicrobium kalidii]
MKRYQNIFAWFNHSLQKENSPGFKALAGSLTGEVLFVDLISDQLVCAGKTFSFKELHKLLNAFNIRYIIIVNTPVPFSGDLRSPSCLSIPGWGYSLWQAYAERHAKHNTSARWSGNIAELQVMEKALRLCKLKAVREAFREGVLVNIFGWLYNEEKRQITDLHTDLLLTLDEVALHNKGHEYITT